MKESKEMNDQLAIFWLSVLRRCVVRADGELKARVGR